MGRISDIVAAPGGRSVPVLKQYIDGRWVDADGGRTFEVRSPATQAVLARVPSTGAAETRRAIDAAHGAFAGWSQAPATQRGAVLRKAADLMRQRAGALARLIALEEGKPITEARGEVQYAADFLTFFADEAQRGGAGSGGIIPSHLPTKRLWTIKQPVGVAGLITIWNFPLAGITRPASAALAAGCSVVLKPAEQTPLCAVAVFELFEEAGLPAGAANLVTAEEPEPIGRELLENPLVRKISFTGSNEVGKRLMRGAADQVKRVTLELGGHAPLVVFEDADLEQAAQGAVASKFRNAGQTCVAVNRVYVHESLFGAFVHRLVELCKGLKTGDPLDEFVRVGPLIDAAAMEKVERHVADALARGARAVIGGKRVVLEGELQQGRFYPPTVLVDVTDEMLVMREETFGPVVPIVPFNAEEDVLRAANAMPLGLAAYFYSRDAARCARLVDKFEYGIVGVNDALPGAAHVPFGGIKQSGVGKEGGRLGLDEFLDTKLVSMAF
jgi:succinate-semialdehyde dehydrogenase/glutarate-semialdehyde dehydrogenase